MHPADINIGQREYSVLEIYRMIDNGKIELTQKQSTHPVQSISMAVESLLLGLTMMPIYADASNPEKWIILDGNKRLLAISEYLAGYFSLSELEFFPTLNGCFFKELPRVFERRINSTTLTFYTINQDVPVEIRLSLIKRITPNTTHILNWSLINNLLLPKSKDLIDYLLKSEQFLNLETNLKTNQEQSVHQVKYNIVMHYIASYFYYYSEIIFEQKIQYPYSIDTIAKLNSINNKFYSQILDTWELGINRVLELFGEEYAFKTSKHSVFINKGLFDILIIYFGSIITELEYSKLKTLSVQFKSLWFETEAIRVREFKNRILPNYKVDNLIKFIKEIIREK